MHYILMKMRIWIPVIFLPIFAFEAAATGLEVRTYKQLRFEGIVRQGLDFTCGGASLATILTHYWGRPVSEEFVLRIFRARYPDRKLWKEKVKDGFSLDDLEFAAAALGFHAQSARIPLQELSKLEGPVIVHLDKGGGYEHFSVLKKVHGDTVYLADSIFGKRGMRVERFEEQYTGHALAVWQQGVDLPENSMMSKVRDGISIREGFAHELRRQTQFRIPLH